MLTAEVKRLTPAERLAYWVTERESVRLKKEAGRPKPWTDDPILQSYRFCNVRRMDDKVSRWLYDNWYKPHRNHPHLVWAAAFGRHFNLPRSLVGVGYFLFEEKVSDWKAIATYMRSARSDGPIFNGAYMVRGIGEVDKVEMVVERVVRPLYENPPAIDTSSMQRSVEVLLPYWGFSSFMAGQVVADLRWAMTGKWADRNEWAPVGPGSARGLARLLHGDRWGDRAKTYVSRPDGWLADFRKHVLGGVAKKLPTSINSRLEAIDYQSTLCELDKYSRALLGEGKPKQRYPGV